MTKWYKYRQNNSGGFYLEDKDAGYGPLVYVEAKSEYDADFLFQGLGGKDTRLGFVEHRDCSCCGARWYGGEECDGDGPPYPALWFSTKRAYYHPLGEKFYTLTKE